MQSFDEGVYYDIGKSLAAPLIGAVFHRCALYFSAPLGHSLVHALELAFYSRVEPIRLIQDQIAHDCVCYAEVSDEVLADSGLYLFPKVSHLDPSLQSKEVSEAVVRVKPHVVDDCHVRDPGFVEVVGYFVLSVVVCVEYLGRQVVQQDVVLAVFVHGCYEDCKHVALLEMVLT